MSGGPRARKRSYVGLSPSPSPHLCALANWMVPFPPNMPQPVPPPWVSVEGSLHVDSLFFHLNLSTYCLLSKTKLQGVLLQEALHQPPQAAPLSCGTYHMLPYIWAIWARCYFLFHLIEV